MGNTRKGWRTAAQILVVLVVLVCYGASAGLQGLTLVRWWVPVAVCVALAAGSGVVLWRWWPRLTGIRAPWVNYLCHIVVLTGVLLALMMGLNRAFARDAGRTVEVRVERKYTETHYRQKRVGRRYVRGEPYKAYYIEVSFPTGQRKSFGVGTGQYLRVWQGAKLHVRVERGFLGMPVIDRSPVSQIDSLPRRSRRAYGHQWNRRQAGEYQKSVKEKGSSEATDGNT